MHKRICVAIDCLLISYRFPMDCLLIAYANVMGQSHALGERWDQRDQTPVTKALHGPGPGRGTAAPIPGNMGPMGPPCNGLGPSHENGTQLATNCQCMEGGILGCAYIYIYLFICVYVYIIVLPTLLPAVKCGLTFRKDWMPQEAQTNDCSCWGNCAGWANSFYFAPNNSVMEGGKRFCRFSLAS